MLRGQGVDPARRYFFPIVGYNFRITNLACALLCAQLERAEAIIADRKRVFDAYTERLSGVEGIGFQPVAPWAEPTPWLYSITVDPDRFGLSRDELMLALDAQGIETRPFFVPVHQLPPYRGSRRAGPGDLPVTAALAGSGMNLPTFGQLDEATIDRIADAIRDLGAKADASKGSAR